MKNNFKILKYICLILALSFLLTSYSLKNNIVYKEIMSDIEDETQKRSIEKNKIKNLPRDFDENENAEVITIKMKTFNNLYVSDYIGLFEEQNPNIKIEHEFTFDVTKEFSNEITKNFDLYYEMFIKQIVASLISGSSEYDIIDIPDYFRYVNSGYLQDLDEFIEKDSDFNMEDYYVNIVNQYRSENDGKLYTFLFAFSFNYGYINKNYLDLSDKYTIDDFKYINYKNSYGLYNELKNKEKIVKNIFLFYNNYGGIFDYYELSSHIDLYNEKSDLNSNTFKDFLTMQKTMEYDNYPDKVFAMEEKSLCEYISRLPDMVDAYISMFPETMKEVRMKDGNYADDIKENFPQNIEYLIEKYPKITHDFIIGFHRNGTIMDNNLVMSEAYLLGRIL